MPKILLIEDDPDTQANLCDILELDGYTVVVAGSVKETLATQNFAEFTAIILDRRLPDGTAEQLLPQLSRLAPNAAVIIVTGHAELDGTIAALRHGAEDYILKPINPDALRASLVRIRKVRDSEQRAQQSERLAIIGQMIAVLTHESRNALQRISAGADMLGLELERLPDNEGALKDLSRIQAAGAELGSLLEEVRHFAAPIHLDRSEGCLSGLWKQAWDSLAQSRTEREVEFIENMDVDEAMCNCDRFRIQQVFRNLFENSLAACSNPVRIEVSCSEIDVGDVPALCVTVSDNGPGLSDEDKQKVFDAFYTSKPKGTGLGMAIVRRVVEAHGGKILVASSGDGASFVFTLPTRN